MSLEPGGAAAACWETRECGRMGCDNLLVQRPGGASRVQPLLFNAVRVCVCVLVCE